MIVIGSNTSDNGQLRFTEDVSHFMELRQNRQLALLKRSAKKEWNAKDCKLFEIHLWTNNIWLIIQEYYTNK